MQFRLLSPDLHLNTLCGLWWGGWMGEIFACASASSTLGYISSMMYDNLERQVLSTSEIVVIGSLLVNEVLLHCLRRKLRLPALEPPFYNACFLQSLKAAGARESKAFTVVKHVIARKFHNSTIIHTSRGAGVMRRPLPSRRRTMVPI
jgi:hypothetical protein